MIKAALEYITGLKQDALEPKIVEIGGKTYCDKQLVKYGGTPMAEPIGANTLTAMVDYISNCSQELQDHMILHVKSPTRVELYSGLNGDRKRETLFVSGAITSDFGFGRWYDQEQFIIDMQANFVPSPDLAIVLQVAGNVESNTTANYGDDGVSQKTTIKQGIASKADVEVPNPVSLCPYRTFLEVQQPWSSFIFRINEDRGEPHFKIIEAEGGLWKNMAMQNIKLYFEEQLSDIQVGNITIIA